MKKLLTLSLLTIGLLMSASQVFAAGETTYEIDSIEDLYRVRYQATSSYIMTKSLDFNNIDDYEDHTSIAYGDINGDGIITDIYTELTTKQGWLPIPTFSGVFDGDGHTISNLYINGRYDAALFANVRGKISYGYSTQVDEYAVVTRVGLVDANLYGTGTAAGLVTSASAALITENFVDGVISAYAYWSAGLVANLTNKSILENNYVTGLITADGPGTAVAGLVGSMYYSSKVANNYVTASIIGENYVSGVATIIYNQLEPILANNVIFSDYIYGEHAVFRSIAGNIKQDLTLFSRYDTRIDVKTAQGAKIASFDPSTINPNTITDDPENMYDGQIFGLSGHFEGFYMTYEDFINPDYYHTAINRTVIDYAGDELIGGFTEASYYSGNRQLEELSANEQLFYKTNYWDFENIWEVLDGAGRPTLRAFNHDGDVMDDGHLSTAPIQGSDLRVNGSSFTGGDNLLITWDQAYLVKSYRDGLLYDVYYSDGLTDNRDEWIKINDYSLSLEVIEGRTQFTYKVPYSIDSSNIRFYIISHNTVEYTDPMISKAVIIDNGLPAITAKADGTTVTKSGETVNSDFQISVADVTNTSITYAFNGEEQTNFVTSKTVFSDEGTYEFTVVDAFGNSSRFTITINKVQPVITVANNQTTLSNGFISDSDITVTVTSDNTLTNTYLFNGVSQGAFTSGQTFSEDGIYQFISSDAYGNETIYDAYIDQHDVSVTIEGEDTKTLTFSELIVAYSFDGETWIDLNDVTLTLNDTEISDIYVLDMTSNVTQIAISEGSSINAWAIAIPSSLGGLSGIGALVFFLIRKKRVI